MALIRKLFLQFLLVINVVSTTQFAFAEGVTSDRVLVGITLPFTGDQSVVAASYKIGTQLLIDRINREGGVHGRKIEVVYLDDSYDPKSAVKNVERFAHEFKVFAILEIYGSASGAATLPVVEKLDIPNISFANSAEDLREPVRKNTFFFRASSEMEMSELIRYAKKNLKIDSIFIAYQQDAAGVALNRACWNVAKDLSFKNVFSGSFERSKPVTEDLIQRIIEMKPEAVVLSGPPKGAAKLIKSLAAANFNPVFLASSSTATDELAMVLKPLKAKVFFSKAFPMLKKVGQLKIVDEFVRDAAAVKLEAKNDYIGPYLQTAVFIEGLKRSGPNLTRDKLLKALEGMNSWDMGGIVVNFNSKSHRGSSAVFLGRIDNFILTPIED